MDSDVYATTRLQHDHSELLSDDRDAEQTLRKHRCTCRVQEGSEANAAEVLARAITIQCVVDYIIDVDAESGLEVWKVIGFVARRCCDGNFRACRQHQTPTLAVAVIDVWGIARLDNVIDKQGDTGLCHELREEVGAQVVRHSSVV
jgi:hypothetical protein